MEKGKDVSVLRTYIRSVFKRPPKPPRNNVKPQADVSATLHSNNIIAGKDVQMHFGSVTNIYHGSTSQVDNVNQSKPDRNDLGNIRPPRPVHILERDVDRERIVTALLGSSETRVAILGMGGIGKTTLAASVIWDPRVMKAYSKQYFLSFEGLSTPELVYSSLSNTFEIPQDDRKSHHRVMNYIMQHLGQEETLVCIDNFETFWEASANRLAADGFLNQISTLERLAIIVTLRGSQEPGNIDWLRIGPLQPLTQIASNALVHKITRAAAADGEEEYLSDLLNAVAGVPLAVTLIGNLLRDNVETSHSLWHRWTKESTQAIGTDVPNRQYQLDVSLRLSVFGPRMNDDARAVLATIAVLPSGLLSEDAWLDEYQDLLPTTINLRNCLRALSSTALCWLDKTASPPRHQLLSPVRQFCTQHLTLNLLAVHKLIDLYVSKIGVYTEFDSQPRYTWFTNELTNITAILNFALSLPNITDSIAYACSTYTQWMAYLGSPTTDIISKATTAQPEGSKGKAKCLQAHGHVLRLQGQNEEAMGLLQLALAIHGDAGDLVEEAWDLLELGSVYRALKRLEDAEGDLTKALELYRGGEDQHGEGNCLFSLADVYDDMDRFSEAERSAKKAIELHRLKDDKVGEANDLKLLGWVYWRQEQLEKAVEMLKKAYEISTEIKYTRGQAGAMRYLGLAHQDGGNLDEAASCFRESIQLFQKCSDLEEARWAQDELSQVLSKPSPKAEVTEMDNH